VRGVALELMELLLPELGCRWLVEFDRRPFLPTGTNDAADWSAFWVLGNKPSMETVVVATAPQAPTCDLDIIEAHTIERARCSSWIGTS
jgi:hypothetical protein